MGLFKKNNDAAKPEESEQEKEVDLLNDGPTVPLSRKEEKQMKKADAKEQKQQAKADAKQAKIDAKEQKQQAKIGAKEQKQQAKVDAKQAKLDEKEQKKQAKVDAKEQKKQAKVDAKEQKQKAAQNNRQRPLMMRKLETAENMYNFCLINNLGEGNGKKWAIKHFQLIVNDLKPGEEVYFVFIGLHNYISTTKHDGNFAYAMTNKRFIMAQRNLLGDTIQSVNINNINDITLQKLGIGGFGMGTICIDTYKETFNVAVNISIASNVYEGVHRTLDKIKAANDKNKQELAPYVNINMTDPVQQVKGLKELLDMGVITQEEFDLKKKELLKL